MNTFDNATSWRYIGDGIYIKDMLSWMKNDFAGESLYQISETNTDGSGCLLKNRGDKVCNQPKRSIVRAYKKENSVIFADLAYPKALGDNKGYIWELNIEDYPRFETEKEMEVYVRNSFKEGENINIGKLV